MTDDGNLHLASEFVITTHENYLLQGRRIVKPVLKNGVSFCFFHSFSVSADDSVAAAAPGAAAV